jgi:hypothetical protein
VARCSGVITEGNCRTNYQATLSLYNIIGRDDLHHLLTMLNQLADAVLKLIGRMERKNESKKRAGLKQRTFYANQAVERARIKARPYLQHAVEKQAVFTAEILDLTQSLQGIEGAPELAP